MTNYPDAPNASVSEVLARLVEDEQFGDSYRLVGLADAMQDFALQVLADRYQGLRESLSTGNQAVRAALPRDPTVRAAIESAWRKHLAGASAESAAIESIVASSYVVCDPADTDGTSRPPLLAPWPAVPAFGSPTVAHTIYLLPGLPDTVHGKAFTRMFENVFGDHSAHPRIVSPQPRHVQQLQQSVDLLNMVTPELAGTLHHTTLVCLVDGDGIFQSGSMPQMPRTIFLSEYAFKDVRTTAESLLHEALHLKLYDIYLIGSVLRPGYSSVDAPTITSIWNRPPNDWPIDRALAAFHVYVHLTAFYAAAITRSSRFATPQPARELEVSHLNSGRRAHYLGNQLRQHGRQSLSPNGVRLTHWLATHLDHLDDGTFHVLPERPSEPVGR